jgi:hypothetical protein
VGAYPDASPLLCCFTSCCCHQVSPKVADEGTVAKELAAAAAFLQSGLKEEGRGLISNIFIQYHSGVANAAGPEALVEPLADLMKRQGVDQPAGQQLAIHDNICEHKFRISPMAFFQVRGSDRGLRN